MSHSNCPDGVLNELGTVTNVDCSGQCGGSSVIDNCGECGGSNTYVDCAGFNGCEPSDLCTYQGYGTDDCDPTDVCGVCNGETIESGNLGIDNPEIAVGASWGRGRGWGWRGLA